MSTADKRIKVACRVRPRVEKFGERYEVEVCRKANETTLCVTSSEDHDKGKVSQYAFDYVFDSNDTQRDIYEEAALELIDSCLDGCPGTIFTYGQTGSGKTWTVLGEVAEKSSALVTPNSGLFLRSLCDLFTYKDRCKRTLDVGITLAIIEIYNEEVKDLLNKKNKVQVREIGDDVQLPNLKQVEVESLQDVYHYFEIANDQRSVSKTDMNDVSSRSHAAFLIDITQRPRTDDNPMSAINNKGKEKSDKNVKKSRLVICDLAGSERVKRSGVEGKAMAEAQAINKSLSCLGNVVNGLYLESKHIPYRDSKLTRLLRSSFIDPSSKVLLITNLSPIAQSVSESISSLRFADRVKGLKAGAPTMMDPVAEQEYLSKLRLAEEICSDLRICAAHNTTFVPQRPSKRSAFRDLPLSQRVSGAVDKYKAHSARVAAEKAEREAREVQEMVDAETNKVVEEWRERTRKKEEDLAAAKALHEELSSQVKTCEAEKTEEVNKRMSEAKKKKKERRNAEEKLEKATNERKASEKEAQGLRDKVKAKETALLAETKRDPEENDWQAENEELEEQQQRHDDLAGFIDRTWKMYESQKKLAHARYLTIPHVNRAAASAFEAKRMEIDDIVESVLDRAIKRAVDRSDKTFISGPSLIPASAAGKQAGLSMSHHAPTPGGMQGDDMDSDDSQVEDAENYDPKVKTNTDTAVQNRRAALVFSKDPDNNRSVTQSYDEEEADKQYLMGIYDEENLIHEIIRYLQAGTILKKHGRNGKPHPRKFWISDDYRQLIWVDPDLPAAKQKKSSIVLKEVTDVVMGQYSKVFRRNASSMTPTEFFLSFTIEVKSGKRTLDVVADTVSEFEAWLIGLAHVLNREPHWGKPAQIDDEEGYTRLSKREQALCGKNHITPTLFMKLKEIVEDRRKEVQASAEMFGGDMKKSHIAIGGIHPPRLATNGALWMTKGELRYLANVDIFRTCVIWHLLNRQQLIYDPDFKPATPHASYTD